jgi:tetratricopeptide (TPR) repeat protein
MRSLTVTTFLLLGLSLIGCQNFHQKHKKDAQGRWNDARVNIALKLTREQYTSGHFDKALVTAQSVLDMAPENLEGHILTARIYLEQDKPVQARDYLAACLELDPHHSPANYFLGVLYERFKDMDQSLEHYQKAWSDDPQNDTYLLTILETLVTMERYSDALDIIVKHVDQFKQDASIHVVAGDIFTQMGQYEQALSSYKKARRVDPVNSKVKEALAYANQRMGHAREALVLFRELEHEYESDGKNESWAFLLAMGDCHMQLGEYHKAKRAFEKVSEHDQLNPQIWTRLARTALSRGIYDEADSYCDRALLLDDKFTDGFMVKGYIAVQKEKYDDAENWFRRVIENDPRNGEAYCLLGQSLQYSGNPTGAESCYRRAIKINPDDNLALTLLSRMEDPGIGAETLMLVQ